MSICSSRVSRDFGIQFQKPKTVVALDHSNIKLSALERGAFVNIRQMATSLSETFTITHKMAFVQPNGSKALAFLEGLGFEVLLRPYNADSLIGLMIGEILGSGGADIVDAIIICSMDGGFACVDEIASQKGIKVYYVGFEGSFSSLLREKNLISLESLGCVEKRKTRRTSKPLHAVLDSIVLDKGVA